MSLRRLRWSSQKIHTARRVAGKGDAEKGVHIEMQVFYQRKVTQAIVTV